jgi:Mor family transcriptional regulator
VRDATEALKSAQVSQEARQATRDQAIYAASQRGATATELAEACELSVTTVRKAIRSGQS